jgi:hypothetical protein
MIDLIYGPRAVARLATSARPDAPVIRVPARAPRRRLRAQ